MSSADVRVGPTSLSIRVGQADDVNALAVLVNAAFRVEQPFIEGDRVDAEGVRSYMAKGKFLVAEDSAGLAGCVYVELRGDRGYLGLLGVDPQRQGTGLGRKLMDAAENFFREAGCVAVDLRVCPSRSPAITSSCPRLWIEPFRCSFVGRNVFWLACIPPFPILPSSGRIPPLLWGNHEP